MAKFVNRKYKLRRTESFIMNNQSPTFSQSTTFSNPLETSQDSFVKSEEELDVNRKVHASVVPEEMVRYWQIKSENSYTQQSNPKKVKSTSNTFSSSGYSASKDNGTFKSFNLKDPKSSTTFQKERSEKKSKKIKSNNSAQKTNEKQINELYDPEIASQYKYLLLKNLNEEVTNSHIYNLFQCYGKVSTIYFKQTESYALIEFENSRQATVSKTVLDDHIFFGNQLEILILSQAHFSILTMEPGFDIYRCRQEIFNSKTKLSFVNYPSDTIYVSNLRDAVCNYDFIVETFAGFGTIEAMKFNRKIKDKNSCFIKFSNISESILAIAHMNMRDVCGRKLNVSFTKTNVA